ncbi:glycopeptide [Collybia nuda]|uniref:Glycopeptide n=1 Tax=Collybia nuda TaxID=64659 RepID=A0A9P5Y7S8_9AGAR|nr:glycopeptide [Collybia nuda]
MKSFKSLAIVFIAAVVGAQAERHTVHLENRCGFGTPTLIQGPNTLSTGNDFTINGNCLFNGERCTLIETTLKNPTSPGGGSSTDISLIPPHAFSVTSGFRYSNGCDGAGHTCDNANCDTAFHKFDDNGVQVACQVNDVLYVPMPWNR